MTADLEDLLDRWLADAAVLAPEAGRDRWLGEGSRLLAGWSEPHRRYHTAEHLAEVLDVIHELQAVVPLSPEDALLARTVGWYHDLAYDPRAAPGSSEHRSATMARDHLHHLGVDDVVVDAVESGVLMTAAHDVGPHARHAAMMDAVHDADLWILAAPPERYAAYRRQVREEYAHVAHPDFRSGRSAVLQAFLARDRLYRTAHGHRRWTARARTNLRGELAELHHGS